ncbi:hypothetical protein B0H66DRAFT_544950 [Apodospora peruviana]|uniref:C3H1-type domain-containing protein n=1 Tax=Apodospora peruviana TaxID=516989 RepID=A0AAE0MGG0_9PEZI|nr:hypothetical protein B0H66DRAFT_544950 [Apodospora peruviana]
MSTEEQEMLARISRLAGQINRHKNQQAGFVPAQQSSRFEPYQRQSDGWRRGSFPSRGHYARKPVHRHRTLVLNGASQPNRPSDTELGANSDSSNSSWITKTDRHLQLINSSVYEKGAQARTRAIEQTRRQKQAARDERERTKLLNHLNCVTPNTRIASANPATLAGKYEISVQGIRFVVAKNGSKLVKVLGDTSSANATPKTAVVGGVRFYRSKNGNLYRHGIIKAQRYVARNPRVQSLTSVRRQSGAVKKLNVPCKIFSMTGNSIFSKRTRPETMSRRLGFGKSTGLPLTKHTGSCTKGPRCRYMHIPEKVAVCKDFLQQGECLAGDNCDLSHELTPERTPACLHFAKDNCTKPNCRYAHVKAAPAAQVCRSFGLYGYCEKGADCTDRHVFECPDFSNTGVCKSKGCKLPHRERASVLRKANTRDLDLGDEEVEDVSSDDESIDSNDVDSDEVDEFIGQDENADLDFTEQRDFIEL